MNRGRIELNWATMLREAIDKMRGSLFPGEFEKAMEALLPLRKYANAEERRIFEALNKPKED